MYKKLIETKIVRTRHEITFHIRSTVYSIINDLKLIPNGARLIEVDMDNDETILVFEEEKNT